MRLAGAWHPQPGPHGAAGDALADSARPIPNTDMSLRASAPPHDGQGVAWPSALDQMNSSKR